MDRPESHALADTAQTPLGQALAPALSDHPGQSGFYPLAQGKEAFAARIALVRAATLSLDVQYYIFHPDDTGVALLAELLAAADRGVRVRLLLDDIHLGGQDAVLAAIDSHAKIEVRIFNPFAHRKARLLDFATNYSRVNRRMHNKSMTADNQLAVVGGRNVGDEYFAAHSDVDFSDLDLLAAGPVVPQVSAEFDAYWASSVVYPISSLAPPSDPQVLDRIRGRAAAYVETFRDSSYGRSLLETGLAQQIAHGKLESYWGAATVIADKPDKVRLPPDDSSTHAITQLSALLDQAQTELLLVSPYFVPRKQGVEWLASLARRGVKVRVLTNSYAATDVGAVHAGYAPYRKALLAAGVELYELKPGATALPDAGGKSIAGSSHASLHAKTYMVDRRMLFVGSLNLDPRSVRLNTEMGIAMESADLCARFGSGFDAKILEVAYRVTLENGKLAWTTVENGQEKKYDSEPGMNALQGIGQFLLRILPVEEQL
ncbi:MAG TPA: phospholipase D family protein [Burkholderiales bacterium]|nr:phospholipase D family protein [Burkholderiales bacterium]